MTWYCSGGQFASCGCFCHLNPASPPQFQRHRLLFKQQTTILFGGGGGIQIWRLSKIKTLTHTHTRTLVWPVHWGLQWWRWWWIVGRGPVSCQNYRNVKNWRTETETNARGEGGGWTAAFRRAARRSQKSVWWPQSSISSSPLSCAPPRSPGRLGTPPSAPSRCSDPQTSWRWWRSALQGGGAASKTLLTQGWDQRMSKKNKDNRAWPLMK